MPASSFDTLLRSWHNIDAANSATDLDLFEQAVRAATEQATDAELTRDYLSKVESLVRRLTTHKTAELVPETVVLRLHLIKALRSTLEGLLRASGNLEGDIARLVHAVSTKKHALRILGQLKAGPRRPADLEAPPANAADDPRLEPTQVHRVLGWAQVAGLAHKWVEPAGTYYGLTARGEIALQAIEEPAWLQAAASIANTLMHARIRGMAPDNPWVTERILSRTGLKAEAVERARTTLKRAIDPTASSRLAEAFGALRGRSPGVVLLLPIEPVNPRLPYLSATHQRVRYSSLSGFDDSWRSSSTSIAWLHRALERSGISAHEVETHSEQEYAVTGQVPLDRPLIAIYNTLHGGIAGEMAEAFGLPALPSLGGRDLRLTGSAEASGEAERDRHAYGFVVRLRSRATGVSHFILGGPGASGVQIACEFFYRHIETLLDRHPYDPFHAYTTRESLARGQAVRGPAIVEAKDPGESFRAEGSWKYSVYQDLMGRVARCSFADEIEESFSRFPVSTPATEQTSHPAPTDHSASNEAKGESTRTRARAAATDAPENAARRAIPGKPATGESETNEKKRVVRVRRQA